MRSSFLKRDTWGRNRPLFVPRGESVDTWLLRLLQPSCDHEGISTADRVTRAVEKDEKKLGLRPVTKLINLGLSSTRASFHGS